MAHFAQLDENDKVIQIIVVSNEIICDENGIESEEIGINFCKSLVGEGTNWVQTSFNRNFRKNYAVIGGVYDRKNDAFIPIKPYKSFIFDEKIFDWIPPIPCPQDNYIYDWNEEKLCWEMLKNKDDIDKAIT